MVSFDIFANFTSTVEAGSTIIDTLIPTWFLSLETFSTIVRKLSAINDLTAKTFISTRLHPCLESG
jgi:hypothetical protein